MGLQKSTYLLVLFDKYIKKIDEYYNSVKKDFGKHLFIDES